MVRPLHHRGGAYAEHSPRGVHLSWVAYYESEVTTVAISVGDSGSGADNFGASAQAQASDAGSGADSLSAAIAALVSDSGSGADSLLLYTEVLKVVSDLATGADTAGPIEVGLQVGEAGGGSDSLWPYGGLQVSDSGSGADSLVISVNVPVADTGSGADIVAQLLAVASVLDVGVGVDIAVSFLEGDRVVSATFSLLHRLMQWSFSQRAMAFFLSTHGSVFTLAT